MEVVNPSTKSSKCSKHYTTKGKKIFLEILKSHGDIIENKRSDAVNLKQKVEAWKRINEEYNSSRDICQNRTVAQLKKLWSNLKHQQRETLTKEKQHRLGTGGGSELPPSEIDPDIAAVAPHLMVNAPTIFSSNMSDSELLNVSLKIGKDLSQYLEEISDKDESNSSHNLLTPHEDEESEIRNASSEVSSDVKPVAQPSKRKIMVAQQDNTRSTKKIKEMRIKNVADGEMKILDFKLEVEKKLAAQKMKNEEELFQLKKNQLVELHQVQLREAEAKAKYAELLCAKIDNSS